jgi:salicylate hydroxylase
MTSRQAGYVYEMQGPEFAGLNFEDGLEVIRKKFTDRMRWVWGYDHMADFNEVRDRLGLGEDKKTGVGIQRSGMVSA